MVGRADKARRTLLAVEIPRDELALVIAKACLGISPPIGMSASRALDLLDDGTPEKLVGKSFRRAADDAVAYFMDRIQAARQPS